MNKINIVFLFTIAVAGCGGHSGTSGSANGVTPPDTSADAYVGTWSGTYHQNVTGGVGHTGTVSVTIKRYTPGPGQSTGMSVTGTAQDLESGAATVTGGILDTDGATNAYLNFIYAGGTGSAYGGHLSLDAAGHLAGTLGLQVVDGSSLTSFDLAPVASS